MSSPYFDSANFPEIFAEIERMNNFNAIKATLDEIDAAPDGIRISEDGQAVMVRSYIQGQTHVMFSEPPNGDFRKMSTEEIREFMRTKADACGFEGLGF